MLPESITPGYYRILLIQKSHILKNKIFAQFI
jgi:hypothetical protein